MFPGIIIFELQSQINFIILISFKKKYLFKRFFFTLIYRERGRERGNIDVRAGH